MNVLAQTDNAFSSPALVQLAPFVKQLKKPSSGFQSKLSPPARRALEQAGISTLEELAQWPIKDLLKLHGLGPSTIPILENGLNEIGLYLKN